MKASALKTAKRVDIRIDKSLNIQYYGESNDYPQRVDEVVNASGTAGQCVEKYCDFIIGRGFADEVLFKLIANKKGQTADYILSQIGYDYARYRGFALHVNYNALYEIVSVKNIPFEHVRFEALDEDGNFNRVALHRDWGKRNIQLRKFNKDDIDFIDLFNPKADIIESQVLKASGWGNYQGQVLYFSGNGDKVYPIPKIDSVLTDSSTEEGVSNIKHRNTRNGFQVAGMFVEKKDPSMTEEEAEDAAEDTKKALVEFQTDENASKILYIQTEGDVEGLKFTPMKMNNYDKDFELTEKTVVQNIGRRFAQPAILRGEAVSTGFSTTAMQDAYNFYNSGTEKERYAVERVITSIFSLWHENIAISDYSIAPCKYEVEPDYKEIPAEILAVMTPNEKRALIGLGPVAEKTDNT